MASDYYVPIDITDAAKAMAQALPLAKTLRISAMGDFGVSLSLSVPDIDMAVFGPTHIRLLARATDTSFVLPLSLVSYARDLTPDGDDNRQYNLDLGDGPIKTVAFLFDQF